MDEWALERNSTIDLAIAVVKGQLVCTDNTCCGAHLRQIIKKLERERIVVEKKISRKI